jgi:hypothetical protein
MEPIEQLAEHTIRYVRRHFNLFSLTESSLDIDIEADNYGDEEAEEWESRTVVGEDPKENRRGKQESDEENEYQADSEEEEEDDDQQESEQPVAFPQDVQATPKRAVMPTHVESATFYRASLPSLSFHRSGRPFFVLTFISAGQRPSQLHATALLSAATHTLGFVTIDDDDEEEEESDHDDDDDGEDDEGGNTPPRHLPRRGQAIEHPPKWSSAIARARAATFPQPRLPGRSPSESLVLFML